MFGYEIDWEAAPAWVQAVGSVAAILVTIWLQQRLLIRQREERLAAYRELVLALMQEARDMILAAHEVRYTRGLPRVIVDQLAMQFGSRRTLLLGLDHRDARYGVIDQVLFLIATIERMLTAFEAVRDITPAPGPSDGFMPFVADSRACLRAARVAYGLAPDPPEVSFHAAAAS